MTPARSAHRLVRGPGASPGAPTEDADRTDLQACVAGCQVAFERLYARHAGSCLALARSMVGDEHLAQDAVQEAFLDLWRTCAAVDVERGSVRAWLTMLTRRRAIDRIRREERQRAVTARVAANPADDASGLGDALGLPLVRLLRAIPPDQRRCLVLAYWGGFTMSEIAQVTGAPVGTVKSRLRAAVQRLRAALDLDGT